MATVIETVVGAAAVVLGVVWVFAPVRMRRLQTTILYLGRVEPDDDVGDLEVWIGRLGGVVLAALGLVLLLGLVG